MVELKNPSIPFDSTEIDNKLFIIPALVVGGIISYCLYTILSNLAEKKRLKEEKKKLKQDRKTKNKTKWGRDVNKSASHTKLNWLGFITNRYQSIH